MGVLLEGINYYFSVLFTTVHYKVSTEEVFTTILLKINLNQFEGNQNFKDFDEQVI